LTDIAKPILQKNFKADNFLFETILVFQWICVIVTDLEERMMLFIDGNLKEGGCNGNLQEFTG
jgi:hypothetical protein